MKQMVYFFNILIIFKQYAHYLDSISENVSINYTYNIWSIIHIFDHRQNNIEYLFNNLAIFGKVWVSMTRLRLKMSESQWWDRDWKDASLNDETETETEDV